MAVAPLYLFERGFEAVERELHVGAIRIPSLGRRGQLAPAVRADRIDFPLAALSFERQGGKAIFFLPAADADGLNGFADLLGFGHRVTSARDFLFTPPASVETTARLAELFSLR